MQADGELGVFDFGEAAGDGDAGVAGEVGGDGEDVGEVHFQRVAGALAGFEGGLGAGGADDGVDFLERFGEVAPDEGADFLGAEVVGVVVPAAEDVGAEDDAALDLGAEAFLAGAAVMVEEIGGVLGAMAVADAVEAGEIGGGLGGGEDVIDGHGVIGVREGDFDDLGAEGFVMLDGAQDGGVYLGVDAVDEILAGHAEADAFEVAIEARR